VLLGSEGVGRGGVLKDGRVVGDVLGRSAGCGVVMSVGRVIYPFDGLMQGCVMTMVMV